MMLFLAKDLAAEFADKMREFGGNTVGVLGPKDYAAETGLPTKCANSVETPLVSSDLKTTLRKRDC